MRNTGTYVAATVSGSREAVELECVVICLRSESASALARLSSATLSSDESCCTPTSVGAPMYLGPLSCESSTADVRLLRQHRERLDTEASNRCSPRAQSLRGADQGADDF